MAQSTRKASDQRDWFTDQRRLNALRDAYVHVYTDGATEDEFYAIDSFDTAYCPVCENETEIVEEVKIKFAEDGFGALVAEVKRVRSPQIYCRECLNQIEMI